MISCSDRRISIPYDETGHLASPLDRNRSGPGGPQVIALTHGWPRRPRAPDRGGRLPPGRAKIAVPLPAGLAPGPAARRRGPTVQPNGGRAGREGGPVGRLSRRRPACLGRPWPSGGSRQDVPGLLDRAGRDRSGLAGGRRPPSGRSLDRRPCTGTAFPALAGRAAQPTPPSGA